ncbi:MAG: DUF4357 domain-containing protein [Ruminococcus sp.]|nr:DUF4357 domain-containing protein [Ruminococcus sp.]
MEKESEIEEFIDYAKVIMGTLGHKLFEPVSKPVLKKQDDMPINAEDTIKLRLERTIKNVGKVEASGYQTPEGFVVLQGSHISKVDDNTIQATIKERRKNAVKDALVDADGVLQGDMLFTSPSYAAMFVIGKRENGLTRWKTEDGRTLKSLEEN